ncbi:MAG: S41 family peptidase [Planctomycetes bacterium]|nr:S41 family peptidase [Planctomycetota bacterium]
MLPLVLGALAAGVYPGPDGPAPVTGPHTASIVERTLALVRRRYYREVPEGVLHEAALSGMVGELDDPSGLVHGVARVRALQEDAEGTYAGIGATLDVLDGRLRIVSPLEGSPAALAGLRGGDEVVAVDGVPLGALGSAEEAAGLIRGPAGTPVRLTVARAGMEVRLELALVRALVSVPTVRDTRFLDEAAGVGYARVTQFNDRTVADLRAALEGLLARGLAALALDLRHNPGGVLGSAQGGDGAVGMADLFLDEGVIVQTIGRPPAEPETHRAGREGTLPPMRLVLLVDGFSASASEIVAGALRDHRRAVLVGTRTFGKGSVQGLFPVEFSPGGATATVVKLTVATYHTPSGRDIHRSEGMTESDPWGIVPDRVVPLAEEEERAILAGWRASERGEATGAPSRDPQVEAALGLLEDPSGYAEVLSR